MMLACHKETDDEAGACYMHSDQSLDMFHALFIRTTRICDWKYYFKNECECFITISKHEKTECLEIVMKHDARVF